MVDYFEILENCRVKLGTRPRRFSRFVESRPPPWMHRHKEEPLWEQFRFQRRLLNEGNVVWGHLVQANQLLFQRGMQDCPATFMISFDPEADKYPVRLEVLAEKVFSVKDTTPSDGSLAELAAVVTDEMERRPVEVPEDLVALKDCHMVAAMVARKHLPFAHISGDLFPILSLQHVTSAVMILPHKFWDPRLVAIHKERLRR